MNRRRRFKEEPKSDKTWTELNCHKCVKAADCRKDLEECKAFVLKKSFKPKLRPPKVKEETKPLSMNSSKPSKPIRSTDQRFVRLRCNYCGAKGPTAETVEKAMKAALMKGWNPWTCRCRVCRRQEDVS